MTLEEGSYAVVPLTTGALLQKSLQASTERVPPKFTFNNTVLPHPYFSSTINDIFRKLDLAVNGMLSSKELNQFGRIIGEKYFMDIKQADFTSKSFQEISCNSNGVSLLGFKQLLFRNFDDLEIKGILNKMGYDEALNSNKSRAFMVSFQATEPLDVVIKDIMESNYYTTAWEQLMSHLFEEEGVVGMSQETDDYTLFVHTHDEAYTCSYAIINHTDDDLKVNLDLSKSKSCLFLPSTGSIEKIVPPLTMKYLGSLACDPDATSFSYGHKIKAEAVQKAQDDEASQEDE